MQHRSGQHLSDQDLLLLLDRELPPAAAETAHSHLADCQDCRIRHADKRRTLDTLGDLFLAQSAHPAPSSSARTRLAQQLNGQAKPSPQWRWSIPAAIAASFLIVLAGLMTWQHQHLEKETYLTDSGYVPNLALTPGAIRPVALSEICATTDDEDDLDPAVPAPLQHAVFQEYGIAAKGTEKNYQIDYLVNPQLGGTDDIRNLWPQSYHSGVWDARAKDQLEERLHQMVCNRTIDLATAQREITTDWIAAYKKYVQRATPRT